jgi:hypothetical protein
MNPYQRRIVNPHHQNTTNQQNIINPHQQNTTNQQNIINPHQPRQIYEFSHQVDEISMYPKNINKQCPKWYHSSESEESSDI